MKAHYVKPVATTAGPRMLLSVAYDPADGPGGGDCWETRAASWSVQAWRRRDGGWHRLRGVGGDGIDAAAVWAALAGCGVRAPRTYVVSPCLSDSLTLLGFWGAADDGRVQLRLSESEYTDADGKRHRKRPHPLVLTGKVDVVGWTMGGKEFRGVGYANHLAVPLTDAARQAGHPPCPAARVVDRPTGHAMPDSAWTASALAAVYRRLIDWWVANGCGRWQDTIGAAAYQWWRTTLPPRTVLEHDHPQALASESAAVQGGRVQLFWFGSAGRTPPTGDVLRHSPRAVGAHLDTPVFKLDVRSMYASLLRDHPFPVRLLRRIRVRTSGQLLSACGAVGVVATVRVRPTTPATPYRHERRGTVYPVGEWWTTLTTPEVVQACERGEVVAVGEVWSYAMETPFRPFAELVTRLRMDAIEKGDTVGGQMCKTLANALGGRLARHGRGWRTEPGRPCRQRWGTWAEVDAETAAVSRCRGIAGVRQRLVEKGERPGGLTACYAHLTAYGRVLLGKYIDTAGDGQTLWCDTDGLIVTAAGLGRLRAAGFVRADRPGFLRVEGEIDHFAARTPKHYVSGDQWTLAGVRDDCGPVRDGAVRCYQSANPVRSAVRPDADAVLTRARTLVLDSIPLAGTPGVDGWLIPPEVRDGRLYQRRDELPAELREWDYDL